MKYICKLFITSLNLIVLLNKMLLYSVFYSLGHYFPIFKFYGGEWGVGWCLVGHDKKGWKTVL